MLVMAGLSPHPPIIVPEIGRDELPRVQKTRQGLLALAQEVRQVNPEVVALITPHGPVFRDAIAISLLDHFWGNFAQFGVSRVGMEYRNQIDLARSISGEAQSQGISIIELTPQTINRYLISENLDHGVLVPLYYLAEAGVKVPIVYITMGMLELEQLYHFGQVMGKVIEESPLRVVLIASGDLSHRLTPDAPAGYDPMGKEFDRQMVSFLSKADAQGIMGLDHDLVERAGECGYRPIIMLLGALKDRTVQPEVISYEGPFGVGYAVAAFRLERESTKNDGWDRSEPETGDKTNGINSGSTHDEHDDQARKAVGVTESSLVRLARETVQTYVKTGKVLKVDHKNLPPELKIRAGVFVTLHTKDGQLRGCIGTTGPTQSNLAEEIIQNAISSSTRDPRFYPVRPEELDNLVYSVDVLKPPEPVKNLSELDPKRYGVIVRKGYRTGLLLPDLEGVDTVEQQLAIARQKAGIRPDEQGVEILRFEVERYH